MKYTADVADAALDLYVDICRRHGWDPHHPIRVMMSESGFRSSAHNLHGHASGIFQAMPDTLRNLGWRGDPNPADPVEYRKLPIEGQLPWFERYFAQYDSCGLDAPERFYLACFLPALLYKPESRQQTFILCAQHGPLAWAYVANTVLDRDQDGAITLGDLKAALDRACQGKRWDELAARVDEAIGRRDTLQSVPSARVVDAPISVEMVEPHETAPREQDAFGHVDEPSEPDSKA